MTRIISIDGNIGSGKSTFVKLLNNYNMNKLGDLKICFLQEPVNIWNEITDNNGVTVIEHFYKDQEKFAFSFQMMAYISRLISIKNELKNNYDIIFTERSILTDRNVFAKMLYDDGKINEIEFKIYNKWFDEFVNDFPEIEFIYLKTDPEIAFNRIIKRGRTGENIPLEYLKKCHKYHEEWLEQYTSKCVLDCNTDIEENPNIIDEWIETIYNYISPHIVRFYGASRGYTGPSAAGFIISNNNKNRFTGSEFISTNSTTDYAIYYGLLIALRKCNENNIKNIIINSSSKLILNLFEEKDNIIKKNNPLYDNIVNELKSINQYKFTYIDDKNDNDNDVKLLVNNNITDYIINKSSNNIKYNTC